MDLTLIKPEILAFCRKLKPGDAAKLPFQKQVFPRIANSWLVQQSELQQLAARKLPEWSEMEELVYPDRQALEQCTSGILAAWKINLVSSGTRLLVDASAGLGVDAFQLGARAESLVLFESDENRAAALKHNSIRLRGSATEVRQKAMSLEELTEFAAMGSGFLLYADPDRRSEDGRRKFGWEQCQPDVRTFHQHLRHTKARLLVKFSPLDDPEEIAAALPGVSEVYLLSVHNEVKEVLMLWDFEKEERPCYRAVELRRSGEVVITEIPVEREGRPEIAEARAGSYLLDPLAALRKGRFASCLAEEQRWLQLSAKARLFMVSEKPENFPGRVFEIVGIYASPSAFRKAFTGNSCHVVARDYPVAAEELRKSLKMKEEGEDFLFCFSDERGNRQVLHTRRC